MILVKYILFAALSTIANIFSQFLSVELYKGEYSLYVAMLVGTLVGLILKYILDKKYIFYYKPEDLSDDGKKFFVYTLMGGVTTVVFWTVEIAFDYLFEHESAKYIGAVIGLSIGYTMKWFLDKKFVFVSHANRVQ